MTERLPIYTDYTHTSYTVEMLERVAMIRWMLEEPTGPSCEHIESTGTAARLHTNTVWLYPSSDPVVRPRNAPRYLYPFFFAVFAGRV
jgi:hypothetical protein